MLCKRNIIFFFMCIVLLCGCRDSRKQRAINEVNIRRGEKNAIMYIEGKYGFTPVIEKTVLERSHGVFGTSPRTSVLVYMSYDNKKFRVYIDGATYNIKGADDYQYDEIIKSLSEDINERVDGIKEIYFEGGIGMGISYNKIKDDCCHLFYTYFDGSNYAEVFEESYNSIRIVAEYTNTDISNIEIENFSDILAENVILSFVSYRNDTYCERFSPSERKWALEWYISDFDAVYMESYCIVTKESIEYNEFNLNWYQDEFMYYVIGAEPESVSIKTIKPHDASKWNGYDIENGKNISKGFLLSADSECSVCIIFPKDKVKDYRNKKEYIVKHSIVEGEEKFWVMDEVDFENTNEYIFRKISVNPNVEENYFAFIAD